MWSTTGHRTLALMLLLALPTSGCATLVGAAVGGLVGGSQGASLGARAGRDIDTAALEAMTRGRRSRTREPRIDTSGLPQRPAAPAGPRDYRCDNGDWELVLQADSASDAYEECERQLGSACLCRDEQ